MPSSESLASPDLKFPPVRVNGSLTRLDLETLMMRSTQRPQPEEASSALEDSNYDMLGDGVMEVSDDEAHTASIASTDAPTPDDTSDEFTDDEADYEMGDRGLQDSIYSSQAEPLEQQSDARPALMGEDSTLTEVPSYLSGNSYKILYIGMPERWAEDITTTQIAMALGAYPSISKSVMVRGQVEPYVPVPQVSRCTGLEVVTSRGKPTRIVAKLEDGKQLEFSHSTAAHFLDRPDLVIMCHRTQPHSSNEREAIDFARTIFAYAEIPCIELAQVIPHGIPSLVEDPAALQVHVEGRDDPNTDYKLKAVLPLNHRGFSRLDPSQLNRHLAYISPRLMTARDTKDSTKAQTSWIGGKIKTFTKKIGVQLPLARTLISALVLCVLIPALFQGAAFAPMLLQKASRSVSALSVLSELENIDSSITPVASESSRLVTPISSSSIPTAMGALTVVPASLKQPSRNPKTEDGKTGSFELQATGDHQFILRPSKAFSSRRKRPQLQIQIACQSQQVPIRYNRTITGEYIVDLEHKYPYGKFNVSIATHSRPLLRQSFEVMLGHNKSMLEQFMDNARSGLMSTQDALRNVSLMATQHMQTYMDVRDIDVASASEQMQQVRQKFQEQFQAKGRLAKQIPGAAWVGLREVTAPVRTSRAMKRARMNALRLRCKMEMAAGLSGKYDEEKQSWACSKVRGDM
ncbi:hypothetical protein GGP41_000562 [Bipolaris sorokiniana]|uniref:Uncharacterized protein n=1 Tax=Cochliobolus sativus TaxID=45130 RepID=A0A8H5ZMY9_COCSA|nr:hypothetical protein GGP41_000562 [Bipolaris sorokiniana]